MEIYKLNQYYYIYRKIYTKISIGRLEQDGKITKFPGKYEGWGDFLIYRSKRPVFLSKIHSPNSNILKA